MSATLAIPYADMAKQEINDFREKFDCGEPSLNEYLVNTMGQHNKKGITPSFLLPSTDRLHPLIGYYSLTHGQLDCSGLTESTKKKLKLSNIVPILRLSRVAIDKHFEKKGFGKILMAEIFYRACDCSWQNNSSRGRYSNRHGILLISEIDEEQKHDRNHHDPAPDTKKTGEKSGYYSTDQKDDNNYDKEFHAMSD